MPIQTSYAAVHEEAFEGQRSSLELTNTISKVAEGSAIAFGRAVVRGTAQDQAILPSDNAGKFLGITTHTTAGDENASGEHLYLENHEMNIIDYGVLWVYTEVTVVPGMDVFYRHTAEAAPLDIVGRFRNNSGTDGNKAIKINGATWESLAGPGELARVKLTGIDTDPQEFDIIVATSGAISLYTQFSAFDTTAGASTATIADGLYEGQCKILKMIVDGGDMVVTPTNFFDGTTLTFNDVNDFAVICFVGGSWTITSLSGAVVA